MRVRSRPPQCRETARTCGLGGPEGALLLATCKRVASAAWVSSVCGRRRGALPTRPALPRGGPPRVQGEDTPRSACRPAGRRGTEHARAQPRAGKALHAE